VYGAVGEINVTADRNGNGVANGATTGWAAALGYGSPIDSNISFDEVGSLMYAFEADCTPPDHRDYKNGYWNGLESEYSGLKFSVRGKPHCGWAQMSSSGDLRNDRKADRSRI
jgi:hypothetical protein